MAAATRSDAPRSSASATTRPSSSTATAIAPSLSSSRPIIALPISMHLELPTFERQRGASAVARLEQHAINARDQGEELPLIGGLNHEHSAALVGRKAAVVEVIAVHRD